MIKVLQAPIDPVVVRQKFSIVGTTSPENAGKAIGLTIDDQIKTSGPVVGADGAWRVEFVFLQPGNRQLEVAIANESVDVPIEVVAEAVKPIISPRLRFAPLPQNVRAEEAFILRGFADSYQEGDQLILRADKTIELARPRVQAGQWQASLLFHGSGKRLIEIIGSDQDRAQTTLEVQPAALQVLPRSIWTSKPTPSDVANLQPRRITMHHTFVSPTLAPSANQSQEIQRMRQLWQSHVGGNGWSDIGYHYVIMPSGRIYEARFERKRGAHDVINDGLGIAFDGVYTSATISPAQFQSAVALCTTLCKRYGIDDPVKLVPTPTNAFGIRQLPRICAHRDRVQTECPGSGGGRTIRLEEIRQAVRQRL
ncbi:MULTISPECIES: peptidoglycan recognition family protein [Trichocoleus]|uniref:Peptidoglycan recognition protein family protein n=1 Tax=Trichocoleus desertorum GB2-A4 TaxID=2933944 RepID=A0ABV0J9M0_9CYAN|nr:peptidoglycan recognition family protein [Trichocoleus sp. FACHB-46]MBD1862304.1 N-acetylmuramoyl-L-alanine amidase [Trichocoleus sp. FACHB-46]